MFCEGDGTFNKSDETFWNGMGRMAVLQREKGVA